MLRRIGVVLSVGLADSVNPSTVGPALFLATGRDRVWRVTQFTIGVFGVNLVAGVILTIGPGRLLLGLVPHPQGTARHVIELVVGVVLLVAAGLVWVRRRPLARHELPGTSASGGSALLAGATIAAIELPTAAPYLAVIAGIVASTASIPEEIWLLVLYNVAFIAPMLGIVAVLLIAGDDASRWLEPTGAWLQRRWPVVLAGLLFFVGGVLTLLGGARLLPL